MKGLNRRYFLFIFIVASLFLLVRTGYCVTGSDSYEAIVVINAGSNLMSSTSYDAQSIVGQSIIGSSDLYAVYESHFGFVPISSTVDISKIDEYDIYDLQAFSLSTRQEVLEKTWQKNNDIYFTWEIRLYAPSLVILGYSVGLDSQPDETIDTTLTYYNGFAGTPISDGRHIFYVKAATSGGAWGDVSSFEFWVDSSAPKAEDKQPAPGMLLTSNLPEISLNLSDSYSGIDIDSIKLYIDSDLVSFTYEQGFVSYTPQEALDDGSRIVRVVVEDMVDNLLDTVWGFTIDASPPTGSILINGGEDTTNFARVRLNLEATDEITQVSEMILSNDGEFDTETWQNYNPLITDWVLAETQTIGIKIVYCKFKDEADNISAVYQDDIRLISAAIDTIITLGPYSPTSETEAEFSYQSTFEDVVFSYKLDDEEWSVWLKDTSISFSSLDLANHIFSVKSAHDLNNDFIITEDEEDPMPAQWTWVIQSEEVEQEEERTLFWRTE